MYSLYLENVELLIQRCVPVWLFSGVVSLGFSGVVKKGGHVGEGDEAGERGWCFLR
jgi:hypothetical protein